MKVIYLAIITVLVQLSQAMAGGDPATLVCEGMVKQYGMGFLQVFPEDDYALGELVIQGGVMRKIELSCKRNSSGSIQEISCQEFVDPAVFKSSMIQVVITSGGFTGMTTAEVNLLNMEGLNTLGQMSCEQ